MHNFYFLKLTIKQYLIFNTQKKRQKTKKAEKRRNCDGENRNNKMLTQICSFIPIKNQARLKKLSLQKCIGSCNLLQVKLYEISYKNIISYKLQSRFSGTINISWYCENEPNFPQTLLIQ